MPTAGTTPRFTWDIVIDNTNKALRVTCNAVTATVNLAVGTYQMLGDGTAADFCAALDTALQSHAQAPVIGVALSVDGVLTITSDKALSLLMGDALTTFPFAWLGCAAATYSTAAGTVTLPYQVGHMWCPETQYSDNSGLTPECISSRSEDMVGGHDTWLWATKSYRDITIDIVPTAKVFAEDAAHANEAFATFYAWLATGDAFTWTPDVTVPATHAAYTIRDEQWAQQFPIVIMSELSRFYRVKMLMQTA